MSQPPAEGSPFDGLILASAVNAFGDDMHLPRLAVRGHLHRLDRGVYMQSRQWGQLDTDQRYAMRVRGAALKRHGSSVLSHHSAAVLWGLPILMDWPEDVHFLVERASGGRSDPGVRRHALGIDPLDVTTLDGLHITTVPRTVIDLAAVLPLMSAIALIDRAIHIDRFGRTPPLTTKTALRETWARMQPFRGSARAFHRIMFASEYAGSTEESASRVNVALCGFPEPVLQHPFRLLDGREAETDFFWPEQNKAGECDGKVKYFDPRMRNGRSVAQVHFDEKQREDAIREQVSGFARWDSATARSQYRLRAKLLRLGLPMGRPRSLER